jgi:hypothetical protein
VLVVVSLVIVALVVTGYAYISRHLVEPSSTDAAAFEQIDSEGERLVAAAMKEIGPTPTPGQAEAWLKRNGFETVGRVQGTISDRKGNRGALFVEGTRVARKAEPGKRGLVLDVSFAYELGSSKFINVTGGAYPQVP